MTYRRSPAVGGASGGGGGAVTSVAGKTGAVTLAESDITNLTTDLAGKLLRGTVVPSTTAYTAALGDIVECDTTGGAFPVTLPAASGGNGRVVVKWVAGTTPPTIALTGSDHVNTPTGAQSFSPQLLMQGYQLESNGSALWVVTADDLPLTQLLALLASSYATTQQASAAVGLAIVMGA